MLLLHGTILIKECFIVIILHGGRQAVTLRNAPLQETCSHPFFCALGAKATSAAECRFSRIPQIG